MRYPRIYRQIMDLLLQIYVLVIFVVDFNGAQANEAVLVDTRTATSDLGWTIAQDSNWVEHTALDGSDNERRIVQVCAIRDQNQNNWLRTHFIEVESAERIYIEIEFSIRACEDVANVKSCKETFNLYYYESDKDIATSTFPPWREGPYVKIDTIAADKRFLPGSVDKLTNFETRDIGPIKKKGIYLAIQDTGACMAIMHVRVYYKYCPPHYQSLATFPRTIAGAEMTSLVAAEGACVANAVAEQKRPKLYCNGEGTWRVPSGTCMCSPGFEPNVDMTRCKPCAQKEYKNEIGNRRCERCPAYSSSMTTGSTVCTCSKGYYRAETDDPTKECTKTPSKPRNLVSVVNNTSVTLRWNPPTDNGGRKDVTFRITCSHCVAGFEVCQPCPRSVDIQPAQSGIKITSAIIKRLNAYSFYVFKVFAENGVSDKARRAGAVDNNFVEALVETSQAAPSPVVGVRTDPNGIKPTSILVIWDQPQVTNGEIIDYEVTAQKFRKPSSPEYPTVADTNEPTRINSTSNQHMKIEGLTPGTAYIIMVRARTTAGYGKFSVPIKAETSGGLATEPGSGATAEGDRTLQLVVAVGCGLLIVILVIAIILFCTRRKQFGKGKKLDVEKQPMFSKEIPGHKTYVDPTTYEDPHRAVRDFTKEIDATTIKIEQVIGGGEFGDVCRGRMRHPGKSEQDVAIKTLKTGYTTQQKLDFLGEASIMGQFEHPNVIRLEGVVTKTRPLMIVTEYMQNGSLDVFLRNHDGEMTVLQLVGILRHIAEGMRYLSDMGYVHRDLAARNILVDDRLVCKVSDFGLSRVLEDDAEASYTTRGGKIPIRWTAPEAITFRKFTSASDVWSYGIVMWEVMSYGERPYWGMSNQDVIQAVGSGYRLPAPMDCPHVQHQLMLDCWKKDRNQRPKFPQIVTTLDRMLKEPTLLKIDSTTVRKPKTPQAQHSRADSSDATTGTTGASSDSSNTGSTERTATPNDDFTSQEDAPLVRQSPTVVPIGNGQVVYRRGSEIQIPTASLQQSPIAAPLTGSPASLGGWLDELSLGQYKDTFKKNGCTSLEQVLQLTSSDLMRMGVTSTPHQERILGSIMSMRESSSFNIYGRRPSKNKNYYQHRAKNYEPEAPPKYEETCRNGRIPNGIPV